MLGGVDSVAHFNIVIEQSESNQECNFHSSIASCASGRSYHQNVLLKYKDGLFEFVCKRSFCLTETAFRKNINGNWKQKNSNDFCLFFQIPIQTDRNRHFE